MYEMSNLTFCLLSKFEISLLFGYCTALQNQAENVILRDSALISMGFSSTGLSKKCLVPARKSVRLSLSLTDGKEVTPLPIVAPHSCIFSLYT